MESSSSFFITLPSNSCHDIYPDNKASEYKVKLVKPIHLNHQYEVALAQIQFPHTWETLRKDSNHFSYEVFETTPDEFFIPTIPRQELSIPAGYYSTLMDYKGDKSKAFLNSLQQAFDKKERARGVEDTNIVFDYNTHINKVEITVKNNYILHLSNAIAQVLGFEIYTNDKVSTNEYAHRMSIVDKHQCFEYKPSYNNFKYTATYAPDLDRGFYSLYVYCNLCSPQFVGDSYVPLLRIVPNAGDPNSMVTLDIDNPHYVPVNVRSFDNVEINIKNDVDELVAFETGKVICKLHFRTKH